MLAHHPRLPVSTRHAFALAFDLAVRRDPLHSLIVPLLLRAPWALALAMIPSPEEGAPVSATMLVLGCVALVGDWLTLLVVSAMLRFRARSVFNTPPGVRPMPVSDSYRQGLKRIPWLVVTETVRNVALALSASFSILPAVLVRLSATAFFHDLGRNLVLLVVAACLTLPFLLIAFRLAVATECVVLDEHDMAGAFVHSFRLMRGRSERWFELVGGSAAFIISVALVYAFTTVMFPVLGGPAGVSVFWLLVIAVTPIIQYAWTFFYLRLMEVESPMLHEVGPMYASAAASGSGVTPPARPNGAPVGAGPPGSGPVA
ncbi:MAG TPA: hypothetical protein VLV15_11190 [Dongiaceae bacterium]|nr:hypothetical protein [Dongiaceae bacterium]